ncbi:MAG: calcium-binding protein [Sphingomonadales bacterium]|nr:MAG: calcium-binding protein [Sphingomonadales bacterium]
MLKTILLATSMLVAAPVFAQDAPATVDTQPAQEAPMTTAETPAETTVVDDAAPAQAATATPEGNPTEAPAEMAAQPAPATTPASPAPVETAAAQPAPTEQPASSQEQVAIAVGRDFGTYDKDADGALSAVEFTDWMGALRKAAEPSFAPESPEAKTWAAQAFTSADADKSASVNKQELTTFLTPKPS